MSIDWNQYLSEVQEPVGLEEEVPQRELPQFELPQDTAPIRWEQYRAPEDRTTLEEARRHVSRIGSRIGETIVGLPGDVIQMVKWLDSKMPKVPQLLQREPTFLQKRGREMLEQLPTSGELTEKMSEITSGFTDPQGTLEEFGDGIIELSSALLMGKDPTKIKNVIGALAKATTAKGTRKAVEKLGAGEKLQFATEMGTLFLMGLLDKKTANKFVSDKYEKARGMIPEGTMITTEALTSELEGLERDLSKGLSTASKNEVKAAVSELRVKVSGGAYPAEELVDAFHDINERMSSKRLFDELSKTERKKLKFRYDKFKDKVTSEIGKYGEANPDFFSEWAEANQAYKTIADSKQVTNFLEGHIGKLPPKLAGSMAVEVFLGHPEVAVGTAGTFAGLKMGELMYRIGKNSSLQKHYLEIIKAATEENLPAMVNSLNRLDRGLKESFISGEE